MKASYNQIRASLDAVNPAIRLYVLHGPDEASARDLADRLARSLGTSAERVDLDPAALRTRPSLLAEEAATLSLFGHARHLRVSGAGDECVEACMVLLNADHAGHPAILIAPTLKAASTLVKLAIASPRAMAHALYVPEGADAGRLAAAIAREHGLRAIGAVTTRIADAAAGDRAIMTREIEKIALYLDAAVERPRELDDSTLDAIGADLGEVATTHLLDNVLTGKPDGVGDDLNRMFRDGSSQVPVLRQLVRRFLTVADLRCEVDRGTPVAQVLIRVFFRERAVSADALRRWTSAQIAYAVASVGRAERAAMSGDQAGALITKTAIFELTTTAEK